MGFGPAWRVQGSEIIPLGGVDTVRIPDGGEYATIFRTASTLGIDASASGGANLELRTGVANRHIQLQTWTADNAVIACDDSSGTPQLAFFDVTPVAQQTKPASPVADPAALKTAVDGVMEALANYGLLTS